MTPQDTGDFCDGFARDEDGAILFRCEQDAQKWPWLKLHPANNIAVQTTNYFALTGASHFAGRMDGTKWTALTHFSWRTHNIADDARHPATGRATHQDDGIGYACQFFDAEKNLVYDVSGAGVVFQTRDFEAWRAKAKAKVRSAPAPELFHFSSPGQVGVDSQPEVFVAPLSEDGAGLYADALVTTVSGFPPIHPFHDGSGDHVNSSHLLDVVQQTAYQLRGPGYARSGTAGFSRYVELDRPFRIRLVARDGDQQLVFGVEQAGEKCAKIEYRYDE